MPPDDLKGRDLAYQTRALDGVSRTFALTIPQLPRGLREVVGNAYLLCRITDTIEDDPALTVQQKEGFSRRFAGVVAGREEAGAFARDLGALLSSSTSDDEHDLIANTQQVIRITHRLRPEQRAILERCVRIMSDGMAEFQKEASLRGLKDLPCFDRYCYYVAGVVGEMLTELFCEHSGKIHVRRHELLALGRSFGQGLQMTNILKDIWDDQERGACWLPRDIFHEAGFDLDCLTPGGTDRGFIRGMERLIAMARGHLENALAYILIIPTRETGIRLHCLWALGMAVLTLRNIHARPSFGNAREVRISRRSVWAVTIVTRLLVRLNPALRLVFHLFIKRLPRAGDRHQPAQP